MFSCFLAMKNLNVGTDKTTRFYFLRVLNGKTNNNLNFLGKLLVYFVTFSFCGTNILISEKKIDSFCRGINMA